MAKKYEELDELTSLMWMESCYHCPCFRADLVHDDQRCKRHQCVFLKWVPTPYGNMQEADPLQGAGSIKCS